jgi:uncharacterized membrane protein YraQ (UPF0718 family)
MIETFRLFSAFALAIFIEAMPFLVLGALLSALIEVFVSTERILRIVPRSIAGGLSLGIFAGVALPTCECGVVPIVRRLMNKGVPPYVAIAYMLAAPIVNPVVLASTYIAFRGSLSMVLARIFLAVIVASVLALTARSLGNVVRPEKPDKDEDDPLHLHHHHDHVHQSGTSKIRSALVHAGHEFMDMGKFLILGALFAAAFKTFLPENIMTVFSGSLSLSIAGMMILAILLSVCSEADSFVAASFVGFPAAAQLAFIGIGPMLDLKLIGMYGLAFQRRMVLALVIIPSILVYVIAWAMGSLGMLNF